MVRVALSRLAGRSAILSPCRTPEADNEPTTASNRLTQHEIDELRASVHRMDAEMQAILAAWKKQAEAE
jgi:hypothetical protein